MGFGDAVAKMRELIATVKFDGACDPDEARLLGRRLDWLSRRMHSVSFHVNQHRDHYVTDLRAELRDGFFSNPGEHDDAMIERCVAVGTAAFVFVHPFTPVAGYKILAPTIGEAIEIAVRKAIVLDRLDPVARLEGERLVIGEVERDVFGGVCPCPVCGKDAGPDRGHCSDACFKISLGGASDGSDH